MWIEKIAKSDEEKVCLFNEYFRELNFCEVSNFEKIDNSYKVLNGKYSFIFSDFDIDMGDSVMIISNFDRFAKLWAGIINSKLSEEDKQIYLKQFESAEKPYVDHLKDINDVANSL